ncbi:2-C-methyl-D-erythritol 4-phosphate cytidylyltransferase [Fulvivirga imtechensis AK7]|uniref:2-C-methyl-D-erythritol 4-phosphate cytidylyltransferase n=1 Tax=Fulvivirga imtechensis AK7 TaxID=1237149 RepID=L8JUU9_9BACT|nr:2-C-methyl-D-erythritol 4-phosphate cytidylyltransferase [Fulvivirga imtechensis]ELR72756.1 2-C-methyl-D-erythritol 4-phosphate cytidylyltransferase [Fulvivirga imtechensis AK7]
MKEFAIIVAGGKGTRMNSLTPKQFIPLNGLPILMHTVNAFFNYSKNIHLILVLPEDDIPTWRDLCLKHNFDKPVAITAGGESRFQSVKNGLDQITDAAGLVAIHDGVRPLISADMIGASFRLAAIHKSAIAAVGLKESLRVTDQDTTKAVDRSNYRLIQTPQTFDLQMIKNAYKIKETADLTDDASVAEKAGNKISLFEGSYENIKVTTPEDLVIAEALIKSKNTGSDYTLK